MPKAKGEKSGKFVALGKYGGGVNRWLRSVVWFDEPTEYRTAEGQLLGPFHRLSRSAHQDGIAIAPGLAVVMGLKDGDAVKVTVERVEG